MRRPDGHGSGHDVEFRVIDPEGSLHWLVSKGLREYNSAGKAVRMRGVAFEVTKRNCAEEEIQKREALLVEAQRIARLGSYEWDVRTNTVRRSEELRRIFGLRSHVFESAFEGYLASGTAAACRERRAGLAEGLKERPTAIAARIESRISSDNALALPVICPPACSPRV